MLDKRPLDTWCPHRDSCRREFDWRFRLKITHTMQNYGRVWATPFWFGMQNTLSPLECIENKRPISLFKYWREKRPQKKGKWNKEIARAGNRISSLFAHVLITLLNDCQCEGLSSIQRCVCMCVLVFVLSIFLLDWKFFQNAQRFWWIRNTNRNYYP